MNTAFHSERVNSFKKKSAQTRDCYIFANMSSITEICKALRS